MKLAIFNGSPRYKKSNSKILTDHFLSGYNNMCSDPVDVQFLANRKKRVEQTELFNNADAVIIIFPLYTDCMPGIVKEFIEDIAVERPFSAKKMGYIVQSGFPEAIQSTYIERYLEKLTKRLNAQYLGTIIKGGVEGIQIMPPSMTKKIFAQFEALGEYYALNNAFSPALKEKMQKPYKLSPFRVFLFRLLSKLGLSNFYWDSNLKKHNAFDKRFDMPFGNRIRDIVE